MSYPKEIKDILKTIPKEHHKDIQKIVKFYYELGVRDTQSLLSEIIEIDPSKIGDYGVYHYNDLDGG